MASSRAFGRVSADMQSVVNASALHNVAFPPVGPIPRNPAISDKKLCDMRVDKLRVAIRNNQVSFPSQIPIFPKHTRPDLQRQLVQLYYVLGWSRPRIRARYGLGAQGFQQILGTWTKRAIELGYIQLIPPDQRFMLPSFRPPIRVVFSRASNVSLTPAISSFSRFGKSQNGSRHASNRQELEGSCRPRTKCDSGQIADVLKHLQAGRTVAEMANEVGVTVTTIRIWKRQHELRLLRRENGELRERLAKLDCQSSL
jgi:hypothetical protein